MKKSTINPTFKTVFIAFLKEFFPCDEFIDAISECKTYQEINATLVLYAENIGSELGIKSTCEECPDKDDELFVLQNRIKKLEEQCEDLDTSLLKDKMKLECFIENHEKFSLDHFTKLMEL